MNADSNHVLKNCDKFAGSLISTKTPFCIHMKLEFHGAAGGVTGSHIVLDAEDFRIGIDAGLFQGSESNQNRLGVRHDPRSIY
jgi:hypothetical protein